MTQDRPNGWVSQAQFEREQHARQAAETRLEAKIRELQGAKKRLLNESESLRAALAETEAVRNREAAARKEQAILSHALAALSGKSGATEATRELLCALHTGFSCFEASFLQLRDGQIQIVASTQSPQINQSLHAPTQLLDRPRRLGHLSSLAPEETLPECLAEIESALVAPLKIPDEPAGAILLASREAGHFSAADLRLLEQVTGIAATSLAALRDSRRNALLVSLIEGRSITQQERILDAPLEAVHAAFSRLTDMQGAVVAILDDLLGAPLNEVDCAIDRALGGVGEATLNDHICVVRSGEDGAAFERTHDWRREDGLPKREKHHGCFDQYFEQWGDELATGREVVIPDVAALPDEAAQKPLLSAWGAASLLVVPMMQDNGLFGFVSFKTCHEPRTWLPGEIHLMRSVTKVIASLFTRREQAEALHTAADDAAKARSTLEAAVEALQDGFALFDPDDRLVICNARYRGIHQRSSDMIVPGAAFEDILRYGLEQGEYAEAMGCEETWLADQLTRRRAPESEIEREMSDGRWLRIVEKATQDGGRVGLSVDITALKLAEKRALADRAAAMEASQDGIAMTDADGCFVYMNHAHLAQFGYANEADVIAKPWTMLYSPAVAEWMKTHAMPELMRMGRWSGEVMGQARDGGQVDQEVSLTRQPDGGILCITRDMRDRRRASAERDRLREQLHLAQRREIIGQMAAGLAHDFNNLLATISGGARLIREDAAPHSLSAAGAQRIQSATNQATGLVKRLLSLGRREAEPVRLDLRAPIHEAADLVRAGLRAPLQLELETPDTPVSVIADPTHVLQTVLNLAINARDALDGGAGEIRIALEPPDDNAAHGPYVVGAPEPDRRYCRIIVSDTGPGMSDDLVSRAFKAYETTKGADGSGLGLAIVSSVVTAAEGALKLDTAPGEGTTFTIYWPEAPLRPEPAPVIEELTGRLDGCRILVVDDHEELLGIFTSLLESVGAEVAPASAPEDVIEALRENPSGWDVLITDFDMPEMTGAELAFAVREHAPRIPVVLVTALGVGAGRDVEIFDAVLSKPVEKDALVRAAELAILRSQKPED